VTPEARARVERHETKRLRRCGANDFPHIDAHFGKDHLEFVDQGDVHRTKDVFGELGGFGDPTAWNGNYLLHDPLVEFFRSGQAIRGQPANDLWHFGELAVRIAWIFPLR
jgi:hypothetical protein